MLNHDTLRAQTQGLLSRLGVELPPGAGQAGSALIARSPVTGGELGRIPAHTPDQVGAIVGRAADAFAAWRLVPGLVLSEWVGVLGLVVLYARGTGQQIGRAHV